MASHDTLLQRLINSLDEGAGRRGLNACLLLACLAAAFGGYAVLTFRGLRDPQAMEQAQLARQLARGQGYVTQCVRPVDLWIREQAGHSDPEPAPLPEMRQPPLYPLLLAGIFRIARPDFRVDPRETLHAPERNVIVPLGLALSVASGLLVYRLGCLLFGPAAGWVSALIYMLTGSVLAESVSGSGTPLAVFFSLSASLLAMRTVRLRREGRSWTIWAPHFAATAALCALAFLSSYALAVLLPALGTFLALAFDRRWIAFALFTAVFAVAIAPWAARNRAVSGRTYGPALYETLQDSPLFEGDRLDGTRRPEIHGAHAVRAVKQKFARNIVRLYDTSLRTLGSGLLICLFLAALFVRFENDDANRLRWCTVLGLAALAGAAALGRPASWRASLALLPLVIVFGTAFFFTLLERAGADEEWRAVGTWLLVALTAAPTIAGTANERAQIPYPPVFPPFAAYVCDLLEPGETLATDIPWATAWYGDRPSLRTPGTATEFADLQREYPRIAGLYLTQLTLEASYADLGATSPSGSWISVLLGYAPDDFPFSHGFHLPAGTREQLFLTDRPRWPAAELHSAEE